ncbi:glutaminyl-tRNA synthetase [Microbotryum lychnidis-dioicae p1A1 Lamole]|uniref:glutamine--tRNA ligase n=1 Tax=Microbotryum lychnidis-dioicae (strain p1A1 Lamole / MvSl-1064) TaxID=683840 RepID=U5HD78_USTV1|nr:glutaminyl-tRNA synthetase [Microbotryum lychnidis-dioicae p1A1 Lamole]|eukprot:KDE04446.1 glutaminyl-tRNA synthetase [Microbotryum lychnidis-dioicae p1A1 Lamole]
MALPPLDRAQEDLCHYFQRCGLSEVRSTETVRSKTSLTVESFFRKHELERKSLSDKQALLMLQLVKEAGKVGQGGQAYLVGRVQDGALERAEQVTAAVKYLSSHPGPEVDEAEFNKACGVGFSATPEQVLFAVRAYVNAHKDEITKLGWPGINKISAQLKSNDDFLRWVNMLQLRDALNAVYVELLGQKPDPKAAAAAVAGKGGKAGDKVSTIPAAAAPSSVVSDDKPEDMFGTGWLARLHKPGGNEQVYPERMEEHLKATGGKVFTRFPPEPNGFLHIGHSKAIAVNFGYAKYNKGHCYLRYDDTNPEAEEQIYFDKILEAVRWLGYEPYKITHSSDHFQKLYDLANELIKAGLAYTSDDTAEDIAAQRGGKEHGPRHDSKDRTKPIEQSLKEFEDMKNGKYKPGEMTLRMKQDMSSPNPTMWDIIAYRVLLTPHHRTGTDWCIYPTYDFTHCLCDSFENISHSLCTTEFIGARTAYEWLCDALKVYKPRQSEYGRLSLEGAITSKRKLLRLVKEGHVSGWDDPRLHTLIALKRRGVPPAAIIAFVSHLGVSPNSSLVSLARFEQTVRQHLEMSTPRLMMVLKPIKVVLENVDDDFYLEIEKSLHPKLPEMGSNKIPFTKTFYIDIDDFRADGNSKDFFRLCPGATVGLLQVPHAITYLSHEVDQKGGVKEVRCRYEVGKTIKPKAWIQWVAEHGPSCSPVKIKQAKIFKRLFKSDDPASLGDKYIEDIDPNSLTIVDGAMIETGIWEVIDQSMKRAKEIVEERKKEAEKNGTDAPPQVEGLEVVRFQGMRVAYFALDSDSRLKKGGDGATEGEDELVLNLIAPLKQDAAAGKKV